MLPTEQTFSPTKLPVMPHVTMWPRGARKHSLTAHSANRHTPPRRGVAVTDEYELHRFVRWATLLLYLTEIALLLFAALVQIKLRGRQEQTLDARWRRR